MNIAMKFYYKVTKLKSDIQQNGTAKSLTFIHNLDTGKACIFPALGL